MYLLKKKKIHVFPVYFNNLCVILSSLDFASENHILDENNIKVFWGMEISLQAALKLFCCFALIWIYALSFICLIKLVMHLKKLVLVVFDIGRLADTLEYQSREGYFSLLRSFNKLFSSSYYMLKLYNVVYFLLPKSLIVLHCLNNVTFTCFRSSTMCVFKRNFEKAIKAHWRTS